LPASTWTEESTLAGVDLKPEEGLRFVQEELAPYLGEYSPSAKPTGNPRDFYFDNGFYERIDAETLYAVIRRFSPARIIELGSGMSTLVIADARSRDAAADPGSHHVYDPYPREDLAPVISEIADLRRVSATEVDLDAFRELQSGDVLFVDTTHTVKTGGDVNRIVLDVLPVLAPGVIVHVHDIFLPWEYPLEFAAERNFFWAEQYLLQAFLAFNSEFEFLFSAHDLHRRYPDYTSRAFPGVDASTRPAAFWLRRVET
jgi:predicted O-methyltransferase YrrM